MKRIEPRTIIKKLKENDLNVGKTARELGITRKTIRKWRNRSRSKYTLHLSSRKQDLKGKSTAPKNPNRKLNPVEEIRLVEMVREHRYSQTKISFLYYQKYKIKISPKTVYNIIKRRAPELITKKPKYRRPRYQNGKCMRPANTKQQDLYKQMLSMSPQSSQG